MEKPAARVGDPHTCPTHQGGPVLPTGAATILIGGKAAARQGDHCKCHGPPDEINKGAMPVRLINLPASRETDTTVHGGVITTGCQSVLVGLAGISGNFFAGIKRCKAMAAGRNPPAGTLDPHGNQVASNTPGQSYNNCGIEASRQIINQSTGTQLTQEGLLTQAMSNNWATSVPGNLYASGPSLPAGRVSLLAANGVAASKVAPTMDTLLPLVAQGRGVEVDVWAGSMPNWAGQGLAPGTGGHSILVTGIEYDANGNPTNVIINDTGMGECGKAIPYNQFQSALIGGGNSHVVTQNPIW